MSDSENRRGSIPDIEKLIEGNPNVDPDQLREAQKIAEQLHRQGVTPPGYGIASPYQGQVPNRRAKKETEPD